MVRHTPQSLGPKVLASRMVRDYTEQYYAPAAASLRRTIESIDGLPFGQAGNWRLPAAGVVEAWPHVDHHRRRQHRTAGYPAARVGLTLTRVSDWLDFGPTRWWFRACWAGWTPAMTPERPGLYRHGAHRLGDGGTRIYSATIPLPLAGSMGYTVRVLPHHPLLAGPAEVGLVKLAGPVEPGRPAPSDTHL